MSPSLAPVSNRAAITSAYSVIAAWTPWIEEAGSGVEGPIQLGPGRAIYVTDPDGNVVEFWSQDMRKYKAGARRGGPPGTFTR